MGFRNLADYTDSVSGGSGLHRLAPECRNAIQNGEAQSCSGAAETLAFHVALAGSCLASDRDPLVRNAPARQASFPSRV